MDTPTKEVTRLEELHAEVAIQTGRSKRSLESVEKISELLVELSHCLDRKR